MRDAQTLSCPDNPDDQITPGHRSGIVVSGPSFSANNLRGLRSAPRKRVDGPGFPLPGVPDEAGHVPRRDVRVWQGRGLVLLSLWGTGLPQAACATHRDWDRNGWRGVHLLPNLLAWSRPR